MKECRMLTEAPSRNLILSKKFFWFGTEPVDTKTLSSFKPEKAVDVANHIASWASETGKGLLFYGEKTDKSAPHSAILLVSGVRSRCRPLL